jgi:hypothetical protein
MAETACYSYMFIYKMQVTFASLKWDKSFHATISEEVTIINNLVPFCRCFKQHGKRNLQKTRKTNLDATSGIHAQQQEDDVHDCPDTDAWVEALAQAILSDQGDQVANVADGEDAFADLTDSRSGAGGEDCLESDVFDDVSKIDEYLTAVEQTANKTHFKSLPASRRRVLMQDLDSGQLRLERSSRSSSSTATSSDAANVDGQPKVSGNRVFMDPVEYVSDVLANAAAATVRPEPVSRKSARRSPAADHSLLQQWSAQVAMTALAIHIAKQDGHPADKQVSLCIISSMLPPMLGSPDVADPHMAQSVQLVHWDDAVGRVGRKIRMDEKARLVYAQKATQRHLPATESDHKEEMRAGQVCDYKERCDIIMQHIGVPMFRGAGEFRSNVPPLTVHFKKCLEQMLSDSIYVDSSDYTESCAVCNSWMPSSDGSRLSTCSICLRNDGLVCVRCLNLTF